MWCMVIGVIGVVHIASLLHDDVVDGAQPRRGKRSAYLVFGNQACVRAGDYMYAKALSLYSQYGTLQSIEVLSDAVMKNVSRTAFGIEKSWKDH